MAKHIRKPTVTDRKFCHIGEPPRAVETGASLIMQYHYMYNWLQQGAWYMGSWPGGNVQNALTTGEGNIHVPMWGDEPKDAGEADRHLAAVLLPWQQEPDFSTGAQDPGEIYWSQEGGAETKIWDKDQVIPHDGDLISPIEEIKPILLYSDDFMYTPDGSNDWTWGTLRYTGLQLAAACVWPAPLPSLTDAEAYYLRKWFDSNRPIAGYEAANGIPGLGEFQLFETYKSDIFGGVEYMSRRCLFSWGHPVGVWASNAAHSAWTTIFGGSAIPMVTCHNPQEDTTDAECYPFVVYSTDNVDDSNQAYIRIASEQTGDQWDLTLGTGDDTGGLGTVAVAQHDDANASQTTVAINQDPGTSSGQDQLKVRVKCDGTAELIVHSVSLWQPHRWSNL